MRENYIVYAAGGMGVIIKKYAEELGLSVIGFYDNNKKLQGSYVDGRKVFTQDEVFEKIKNDNTIGFIIGSESYLSELLCEIYTLYGNAVEIIQPDQIQERYWNDIVLSQKKQLKEQYKVDYSTQILPWIDGIMDEVAYWVKCNVSRKGMNHNNYVIRFHHQEGEFCCSRLHRELHSGDTVLDVGCGICTPYGNRIRDGRLNLTAVDPLAFFYNKINKEYTKNEKEWVKFGMFEFLSAFYEKDSVDVILVDNAMDHCIDPFKSILECLCVIKTGGVLSMNHRRCEAVYEGYTGLHKWNIDINDDKEFIVWNKENFINVSGVVRAFAEVRASLKKAKGRKDEFIEVEIVKEKAFEVSDFYEQNQDKQRMGDVIQAIMRKLSDQNMNLQFQKLLEII